MLLQKTEASVPVSITHVSVAPRGSDAIVQCVENEKHGLFLIVKWFICTGEPKVVYHAHFH